MNDVDTALRAIAHRRDEVEPPPPDLGRMLETSIAVTHGRRRRALALAAAVLVVAGSAIGVALVRAQPGAPAVTAGSSAPSTELGPFRYDGTRKGTLLAEDQRHAAGDVTGELLNGSGQFSLVAARGKVVVLNYWATYCGPCITEASALNQLYLNRTAEGVDIVGIDVKEVSRGAASTFVTNFGIRYPIVYDQDARTALQLGDFPASSLPATVVIDRRGRVAAVYVGALQALDLDRALTTLIKEK